ncbi:hypothetical protein CANCADRAFT_147604 [Tortispora caseinolytica NRRL Y-17796]|uniref:Bis(5'-adenosyl)-triphosphatase n=1 Tax=Tortispora caseinolytica NRRL Y-17796 TaxID=767744 RepID=A0A1E4TLD7_9ASCO|nr:hypothetical protein CANCADRAFT_147604 [Tortispora caseinolytica NRRL Y-17796]
MLFGKFNVSSQVFYKTQKSFALVNLKPLLPGHVLVCPIRVIPRVHDLDPEEVADFYATVHRVAGVIERVYKADGMQIVIQDGPCAGQSVYHVHCHIIPRHINDLPNVDDLYTKLNSPDANLTLQFELQRDAYYSSSRSNIAPDADRKPRSPEEMAEEAQFLAGYFV